MGAAAMDVNFSRPVRLRLMICALVLAEVVSAVEATMVYAALRQFYRDFGDPVLVGWIVTAFLLVAAASAAVCSRLGDQFGHRRVLMVVLGVAAVGSLTSACATSIGLVIAGRAIQGLSGAVMPLCFGIVRKRLPMAKVPLGVGIVSAAAYVSGGVSIFAGGVLVDHLSWHWVFYVGFAMAALALAAVTVWVPPEPKLGERTAVDWPGVLLLVPAITALLIALSQGKAWGWTDLRTGLLASGGLIVLALWLRHELRTRAPLIDVRLLGMRQLALANLGVVLLALGPLQSGMVLSLLLQQPSWTGVGLGLSATTAGLVLAPPMLLAAIAGPGCGLLAARFGARCPALLACVLLGIGWCGIAALHTTPMAVLALALVQGIGSAMAFASAPLLIVEVAPVERTSEVTGVATLVRHVFNAIGSQIVAVLLATAAISDPTRGPGSYPAPDAYALTLGAIAGLSLIGVVVTLALPRRRAIPLTAHAQQPAT